MPVGTKKEVELTYLEMARAASSIIPPGEVQWDEKPDARIQTSSGVLGIEITKLYQTALPGDERTPMETLGLRNRIIQKASLDYRKMRGQPVTVEVFFSTVDLPQQWKQASDFLARFVFGAQNIPVNGKAYKFGVDARDGYQQINIRPSLTGNVEWCEASENDRPRELQCRDVKSVVDGKNLKLTEYQEMPLGTWLLMVVDPFPRAAYICVSEDAESWSFTSDFGKILLFSREDNRVFEFGKS